MTPGGKAINPAGRKTTDDSGHLPHLSRLASLLILGTPDKEVIKFTMGGIVCLGKRDDNWLIEWALIPKLIHK